MSRDLELARTWLAGSVDCQSSTGLVLIFNIMALGFGGSTTVSSLCCEHVVCRVDANSLLGGLLSHAETTVGFVAPVFDTCGQKHRNRGGNGGACPRNAETAGAKVSFRCRNNLPSLSAG